MGGRDGRADDSPRAGFGDDFEMVAGGEMLIWKQEIPIEQTFQLQLPVASKILCVQVQNGRPTIWFSFEGKPAKKEARNFILATTGHEVDLGATNGAEFEFKYVGTFQLAAGAFIGHLYVA